MTKGISTRPTKEEAEALRRAFDGPQGPWPWDWVSEFKFRAYDGHYVVVKALQPNGRPVYADLARAGTGRDYQFQNDSLELTDHQWKHLTIPEECDWFEVPDA